jgi:hypothetical protein
LGRIILFGQDLLYFDQTMWPITEETVRDIAKEIGSYYEQDRPRCFEVTTGDFPLEKYAELCL